MKELKFYKPVLAVGHYTTVRIFAFVVGREFYFLRSIDLKIKG